MFSLAKVQHPVEVNHTIIFMGKKNILFPTAYRDHIMEWHVTPNKGVSSLEQYVSENNGLSDVKWDEISQYRHFLGYCPEARLTLASLEYQARDIEISNAEAEGMSGSIESLSLSLGSEGQGNFVGHTIGRS